jgi:hypothetical protein
MTTVKVVSTRRIATHLHLDPLTNADEAFFLAYLDGFHGQSFGQRLRGKLSFFRIMLGKTLGGKKG